MQGARASSVGVTHTEVFRSARRPARAESTALAEPKSPTSAYERRSPQWRQTVTPRDNRGIWSRHQERDLMRRTGLCGPSGTRGWSRLPRALDDLRPRSVEGQSPPLTSVGCTAAIRCGDRVVSKIQTGPRGQAAHSARWPAYRGRPFGLSRGRGVAVQPTPGSPQLFRLLQIARVADVQEVEAAVGKDDALPAGATRIERRREALW